MCCDSFVNAGEIENTVDSVPAAEKIACPAVRLRHGLRVGAHKNDPREVAEQGYPDTWTDLPAPKSFGRVGAALNAITNKDISANVAGTFVNGDSM
jgi:hypothetical protein